MRTLSTSLISVALLLSVLLLPCGGCKKSDPEPAEQLPLATQTGNRAFGCLLNGKVWVPKGYNGTTNYSISYDPTYAKGTLNISAYRYLSKDNNDVQYIALFSDSLTATGIYPLTIPRHQEALFVDSRTNCTFLNGDVHYRRGTLTITRLDKQAGIISGTFAFTLYKPGCDSIRVTDGRFDYQF